MNTHVLTRTAPTSPRTLAARALRSAGLVLSVGTAAALLAACGPQTPDPVAMGSTVPGAPGTTTTIVTTTTTTSGPGMSASDALGTPVVTSHSASSTTPAAPKPVVHARPAPTKVPTTVAQATEPTPAVAPRPLGPLGNITAIEPVKSDPKPTNGAGAVIGGLLGGVLGHQVGGGDGNKAATVLGAVGGAVAGNNVQKNRDRDVVGYRFHVTLDNGQTRELILPNRGSLNNGDRVRVVGDSLRPA